MDAIEDNILRYQSESIRERIQKATDETVSAHERVRNHKREMKEVQYQNEELKKRLEGKDLKIISLIEMIQMYEMNDRKMSNDTDKKICKNELHSTCLMNQDKLPKSDKDVEEYERQMEQQFQEIHELHQENKWLNECLQGQKEARHRAAKALKVARKELQSFKEMGYPHLLQHLEDNHRILQKECEQLRDCIDEEKKKEEKSMMQIEKLKFKVHNLDAKNCKFEALLQEKDQKIEDLSMQVSDLQYYLENMHLNYKLEGMEIGRRKSQKQIVTDEEFDLVVKVLHQERDKVRTLTKQVDEWKNSYLDLKSGQSTQALHIPRENSNADPNGDHQTLASIEIPQLSQKIRDLYAKLQCIMRLVPSQHALEVSDNQTSLPRNQSDTMVQLRGELSALYTILARFELFIQDIEAYTTGLGLG